MKFCCNNWNYFWLKSNCYLNLNIFLYKSGVKTLLRDLESWSEHQRRLGQSRRHQNDLWRRCTCNMSCNQGRKCIIVYNDSIGNYYYVYNMVYMWWNVWILLTFCSLEHTQYLQRYEKNLGSRKIWPGSQLQNILGF